MNLVDLRVDNEFSQLAMPFFSETTWDLWWRINLVRVIFNPPKKLFGCGVSTPYTLLCLICTISSKLNFFLILTHLSELGLISAGFSGRVRHPLDSKKLFVQLWALSKNFVILKIEQIIFSETTWGLWWRMRLVNLPCRFNLGAFSKDLLVLKIEQIVFSKTTWDLW